MVSLTSQTKLLDLGLDDSKELESYLSSSSYFNKNLKCGDLYTSNLEEFKSIKENEIIASYVFVLNQMNELMLYYDKEWKVPGGCIPYHIWKNNVPHTKKVIKYIHEQMNVLINLNQLIGVKVYKKTDSIQSKTVTQYITYYLALVADDTLSTGTFFRWSKIIDLTLYNDHADLLSKIYNPLKMKIISDLDHTLFESAILTTSTTTNSHVSINDNVFKMKYPPDGIVNIGNDVRYIWTRPYMKEFLQVVSKLAHLSYWTAGGQECQEAVMKSIQIYHYSQSILYVDSCSLLPDGFPYKSLNDLNKRLRKTANDSNCYDPQKTLLIDDMDLNNDHNKYNCYKIYPWKITGSLDRDEFARRLNDKKLLDMIHFLRKISDQIIHEKRSVPSILLTMENLAKINGWIQYPIDYFPIIEGFVEIHTDPAKIPAKWDTCVEIKPSVLGTQKVTITDDYIQ